MPPRIKLFGLLLATGGVAVTFTGVELLREDLILAGTLIFSLFTLPILLPFLYTIFRKSPLGVHWDVTFASALTFATLFLIGNYTRIDNKFWEWVGKLDWEKGVPGAIGAAGQVVIAILAVWVAGRQNEITEKLTTQQNVITQQQTIDAYFQGISELILDEEGQMEDWPLERVIAEARTAALLASVDAGGKAKVIRFLSSANLLTPLRRDGMLGRPILDGSGGYVVDLETGVRVINLGSMLAGKDLSYTDLRRAVFTGANLTRVNFEGCNLTGADFTGAILLDANLRGTDLTGAQFFHGHDVPAATPRSRTELPNFRTGAQTGAVVEGVDLTGAIGLSPEQRQYLCAWGGTETRRTVPGGCRSISNLIKES
jgi:uncharacterized protein YjbI with pentapeptide repeats